VPYRSRRRHHLIVVYKTAFYSFYLPVALAMRMVSRRGSKGGCHSPLPRHDDGASSVMILSSRFNCFRICWSPSSKSLCSYLAVSPLGVSPSPRPPVIIPLDVSVLLTARRPPFSPALSRVVRQIGMPCVTPLTPPRSVRHHRQDRVRPRPLHPHPPRRVLPGPGRLPRQQVLVERQHGAEVCDARAAQGA
jgi:hypothetical protein